MITGKTALVGIIGDPVEHSLSPPMHNAAFQDLKMDYVYIPFHVTTENLGSAINGAKSMGIKGLNVTIPHKTAVLSYLDEVDSAARLIGAVNTLKFVKGKIKGYNTDGVGAVKALEEITKVKDKKVIIMGAGGASRAIAFQLILSGIKELALANRTMEKALQLASDIKNKTAFSPDVVNLSHLDLASTDILINTTPVGMHPHQDQKPLVTTEMMHPELVVNDIIYNPLKTRILTEAENAGAKTINGTKMLVYQGVEAFRIWTGVNPPVEIFNKALLEALSR
ncbi:MAG TPA: shikimate dehydrogenase [Methanobacteriaceae archaeon]|nr:shikimate dehydrogenase [Methanobacteriaceae archaeon]